jgi:hypothetical protein
MSTFYEWLNTYKSDSFLKDFDIALSDTKSTNDTLTITGANNDVVFNTKVYGGASDTTAINILQCNTASGYQSYVMTNSGYELAVYVAGAMLCNNGLMIKLYLHSHYENSNYYATEYVIIGKDDKNNLCIVIPRNNANGSSYTVSTINTGFRAICYDESRVATVVITAQYGEAKTSLCPILIDSNYDSTLLEIYQSLQTQLNSVIFDEVTIGGDSFASNGYWFIKD